MKTLEQLTEELVHLESRRRYYEVALRRVECRMDDIEREIELQIGAEDKVCTTCEYFTVHAMLQPCLACITNGGHPNWRKRI